MSQKFQASVSHRDDVSYVKLGGVIDEDNELPGLVEKIPAGMAVIDLADIERINSCGVRDWVNWLGRLESQGTSAVLVSCSPAIVAQINLVNNFTGSGSVKSFFVPYFCPDCDQEKLLLAETAEMGPAPHEPPICRCDECDRVMDFDDLADSYFAFLANHKAVPAAERLGAMNGLGPAATDGRVRSRPAATGLAAATQAQTAPSLPPVPRMQPRPTPMPQGAARLGTGAFGGSTQPGMRAVGTFAGTQPGSSGVRVPGTMPGSAPGTIPGTNPGQGSLTTNPGGLTTNPGGPGFGAGVVGHRAVSSQPRSSAMIYLLVAVLLAAIGVLTFLLVAGK